MEWAEDDKCMKHQATVSLGTGDSLPRSGPLLCARQASAVHRPSRALFCSQVAAAAVAAATRKRVSRQEQNKAFFVVRAKRRLSERAEEQSALAEESAAATRHRAEARFAYAEYSRANARAAARKAAEAKGRAERLSRRRRPARARPARAVGGDAPRSTSAAPGTKAAAAVASALLALRRTGVLQPAELPLHIGSSARKWVADEGSDDVGAGRGSVAEEGACSSSDADTVPVHEEDEDEDERVWARGGAAAASGLGLVGFGGGDVGLSSSSSGAFGPAPRKGPPSPELPVGPSQGTPPAVARRAAALAALRRAGDRAGDALSSSLPVAGGAQTQPAGSRAAAMLQTQDAVAAARRRLAAMAMLPMSPDRSSPAPRRMRGNARSPHLA